MSDLTYSSYPGVGQWAREVLGYSQAVRVGDRIDCSGQGGWDPHRTDIVFPDSLKEEMAQAFANVDLNLKDAGGEGWTQVFRVNSYHTEITPEVTAIMTDNYKKWMPDHMPIWTQIGVKQLGVSNMHVEIEVVAYDGGH